MGQIFCCDTHHDSQLCAVFRDSSGSHTTEGASEAALHTAVTTLLQRLLNCNTVTCKCCSRNQTPPPICMYIWGWCLLLLIEQRKLATSGLQHKPEPCCNQVCWVLKVQAHFTPLKCTRKDCHAPLGIQGILQDRVLGCVQVSITTGNCLGISQTESYNTPEGVAALMLLPILLGDPLCRSGQDSAKHGTKLV